MLFDLPAWAETRETFVARLKPLNAALGYKTKSYTFPNGVKLELGEEPQHAKYPKWHVLPIAMLKLLMTERTTRHPDSPCRFDFVPTIEAAKALEQRERMREKPAGGGVVEGTGTVDDPIRVGGVSASTDKDAEIAALQFEIARLKEAQTAEALVPEMPEPPPGVITTSDTSGSKRKR